MDRQQSDAGLPVCLMLSGIRKRVALFEGSQSVIAFHFLKRYMEQG
jgi:hypothetical protein